MSKKILAILLAAAMLFAFAACGDDTTGETTTTTTAAEDVTDEAPVEESTDAPAVDTSDVSAEEPSAEDPSTADPSEAESTTEATNAMPEGKEAIVEYFNTAINGVKTGAKSVNHQYSKITISGETKFPGFIDAAMKLLGGADNFINDQLAKQSKGEQTYTGATIKEKFPVETESYASKLTAADVNTAKVVEKDGKYVVTLVLVSDAKSSTVKHGQGHAPKAFNVVLPGVVNDNVPGPVAGMLGGEAEMNYPACKVIATIDPATGNVVNAEYFVNWTINFGDNIVLPFTTHDLYTINW
ncbi:MAG: hypothetical protein E7516_05270 [Ruminococcaceae bacterium]|nr:hypothetical protein [Oscillospiraceae bacterium]